MVNKPIGYGNTFNSQILKDIDELNKKIKEEKDDDELLNLRLKRLYRGMELNSGSYRPFGLLNPW